MIFTSNSEYCLDQTHERKQRFEVRGLIRSFEIRLANFGGAFQCVSEYLHRTITMNVHKWPTFRAGLVAEATSYMYLQCNDANLVIILY